MLLLLLISTANSVGENVHVHSWILLANVVILLFTAVLSLVDISRVSAARSGSLAGLRGTCTLLRLAWGGISWYLLDISVLTCNSLVKILNSGFCDA